MEKIVYSNEENAWKVVRLSRDSGPEFVAVGSLAGVQPGETLRMEGSWERHRQFGPRFKVSSFTSLNPATLKGIEKYLASGLVQGIGPEYASRIVRQFGLDTLRVIDEQGQRLTEVPGIGRQRAERILQAWQEGRAVRGIMVFLQGYGISASQAVRIYRRYGPGAREKVRENPYRLAEDIFGIGFRTADAIAANLGVDRASTQRVSAGLLHLLREAAAAGHVFLPPGHLLESVLDLLELRESAAGLPQRALQDLLDRGRAAAEPWGIYLPALHAAERESARELSARTGGLGEAGSPGAPASSGAKDLEARVAGFERHSGIRLSPEQRDTIRLAEEHRLLLITGGPGTGKTTVIRALLAMLSEAGGRIALAAPTGRAAKRMEEASGRPARTLHRLLEFSPQEGGFQRNRERPLELDCLIVDEMSMVDLPLFHALLQALPPDLRLILVGDADQLPSVGPGSVLHDLIRCGRFPVVALKKIFRQAEASRIVVNAHRILNGDFPLTEGTGDSDFYFIAREEPEQILETVKHLVARRIPQRFRLDPCDDLQVLVPMYKGVVGADNLNRELQSLLNPAGEAVPAGRQPFRRGDRVMQLRNNYDLDVFNGDVGRVGTVDPEGRTVEILFDDRRVRYRYEDLDELTLAYACSIHKAQGSEYPAVVIPLHTQHALLLRRNLLYTAVTRGRKLVVVVGSRRALALALKRRREEARHSRLAERLAELLPG